MNIVVSVPSLPVLALAVNQFQVLRLWHCGFLNEFWRLKLNYLYPQVVQMCSVFGIIYQFFEPLFNVQTKPTETCYFRSIQYWICCGFFFYQEEEIKMLIDVYLAFFLDIASNLSWYSLRQDESSTCQKEIKLKKGVIIMKLPHKWKSWRCWH